MPAASPQLANRPFHFSGLITTNMNKPTEITRSAPHWLSRALAIGLLVAVMAYFLVSTLPVLAEGMYDFGTYVRTGDAIVKGINPYFVELQPGQALFIYPPIFVIVCVPLALLPAGLSNALWFSLSLASLVGGCILLQFLIEDTRDTNRVVKIVLVTSIALLFYPVWTNAKLGQSNSIVFCLVVGALLALGKGRMVVGGILIGLASSIKLIPLVIIGYALITRKVTFAVVGGSVFVALQVLSGLLFPGLLIDYWLVVAPSIVGQNVGGNISVPNLVRVLGSSDTGLAFWAAIALSGCVILFPITRALCFRRFCLRDAALLITATAIIGPLVENHHLVWLLLPIWLLILELLRKRNIVGIGLWLIAFLLMSQPYRIARMIEQYTQVLTPPSAAFQGGIVLTSGTVIMYLLLAGMTSCPPRESSVSPTPADLRSTLLATGN